MVDFKGEIDDILHDNRVLTKIGVCLVLLICIFVTLVVLSPKTGNTIDTIHVAVVLTETYVFLSLSLSLFFNRLLLILGSSVALIIVFALKTYGVVNFVLFVILFLLILSLTTLISSKYN